MARFKPSVYVSLLVITTVLPLSAFWIMSLFLMRALIEFVSSADILFSNLQLSLKNLKDDNDDDPFL